MITQNPNQTQKQTPKQTPFTKLLVANRGEIAIRVMRTAKGLGLSTVAVYSSADSGAQHVLCADEAVCIGQALPAQSYLNIPSIIEAAKSTGADAIHPGYGFLAENEDFAQACIDAGIVFVGPSPRAIIDMGNKARAKEIMQAAGVPCIPGYQGSDQSPDNLHKQANIVGYPVMIKATAGGGGRGMRLVTVETEFFSALQSAKSEALNAFGNDEVILERAIADPRHIEIQIIGDRHGNAIHLGERDCSVQRRHQKIIEESPSPAVNAELRERMGAIAIAAVKAIAYEGAGTLEFLLDQSGNFYFMEMNTRLQVEHPVTEAVTGLDLVALQLQVASGERLAITQKDVQFNGHAIEVRLCAENEAFMPQSGKMMRWQAPRGVRVDTAMVSGAHVSPYYDSMIAKIIAHGSTRSQALQTLKHELAKLVALGISTNQTFLLRCLNQRNFSQGNFSTGFIAQHNPELLAPAISHSSLAVAAVLLRISAQSSYSNLLHHTMTVPMRLEIDGNTHSIAMTQNGSNNYQCAVAGQAINVQGQRHSDKLASITVDGVSQNIAYVHSTELLAFNYQGNTFSFIDKTLSAAKRLADTDSDGKVRAALNARVVHMAVNIGDNVVAGQAVCTLEAMKMEHVHKAPIAGSVKSIQVSVGDQVSARSILIEIEVKA